jgi:hypothetical protein
MLPIQLYTLIGAIGLLSCLASLIALHLLPTGFHPLRDPVSNYALSRYGFLYRLQAFSSGICGACLMVAFGVSGMALPLWGITALVFYSLSRLLIIFFPTDLQPPRTLKGTIHVILAAFTFTGIAIAAGILTPSLVSLATWSEVGAELHAAALMTGIAAIAFVIAYSFRPFRQIAGLIERGIYTGTILWLGIVYVQMLRLL